VIFTTTKYVCSIVGKLSLVSTLQSDSIYTIQKRGLFSIGCWQPILKIIIDIDLLKAVDTNKCLADRYLRHYFFQVPSLLEWPSNLSQYWFDACNKERIWQHHWNIAGHAEEVKGRTEITYRPSTVWIETRASPYFKT
jgi:hypothetical protein